MMQQQDCSMRSANTYHLNLGLVSGSNYATCNSEFAHQSHGIENPTDTKHHCQIPQMILPKRTEKKLLQLVQRACTIWKPSKGPASDQRPLCSLCKAATQYSQSTEADTALSDATHDVILLWLQYTGMTSMQQGDSQGRTSGSNYVCHNLTWGWLRQHYVTCTHTGQRDSCTVCTLTSGCQ